MDIADIMEKELAEHVEGDGVLITVVQKMQEPSIRYVSSQKPGMNLTTPKIVNVYEAQHAKPNTPTRFELNAMRDRINIHRRWIQLGIIIGSLGLGSKIPGAVEWYEELRAGQTVIEKTAQGQYTDIDQLIEKQLPSEPRNNSFSTKKICFLEYDRCYAKDSQDADERRMYVKVATAYGYQ